MPDALSSSNRLDVTAKTCRDNGDMARRGLRLSLTLALLLGVGCRGSKEPATERGNEVSATAPGPTRAKGGSGSSGPSPDACDLPSLGTSMFSCLLPASDWRHDPSKRVAADIDCFWQVKAPFDKELRTNATGSLVSFTFHVENKCRGTDVEVEFQSPPGTLSNWHCPVDRLLIPDGTSNSFTCYTSYAIGAVTRSRSYTLRVVNVNGQLAAPVELDPEIVLERSGVEASIPPFKVRSGQ